MTATVNTRRKLQAGFGSALGVLSLTLALAGCGGAGAPQGLDSKVSGLVASGAAASGTVSLKDSSSPAQERTATIDSNGAYALDVGGLTPPYLLTAVDASGTSLSALAPKAGVTNIDPLTTAVTSTVNWDSDRYEALLSQLRTILAPLFQHYGITRFDDDATESSAFRTMLKEVSFTISGGVLTVTNMATGGVIFSGPLKDLASGTFDASNIPGGTTTPPPPPPPSTCTYTYSAWGACQADGTQTRTVLSSTPAGCTGTPVLSQACVSTPPPPATCTSFTYSAWGACQMNNTQTRTVVSSSPAGCTGGTPVLSQACTYVPPVTTCTSFTYSAWGACQSNNTQTRTVASSSPAGCTGGTPVLTQACTYVPPACTYTYSAWGTCSASGTQTRTVVSSSPAGCAGTPVLSQACTPPPPANPVTTANVVSSCTGCHGLTSNTTVFRSGGYTVTGRSAANWLTTVNSMVGMGAALAPGTTAQNYADFLANAP